MKTITTIGIDLAKNSFTSRALLREHGCPEKWIEQRMLGQETRNKLTDYAA